MCDQLIPDLHNNSMTEVIKLARLIIKLARLIDPELWSYADDFSYAFVLKEHNPLAYKVLSPRADKSIQIASRIFNAGFRDCTIPEYKR